MALSFFEFYICDENDLNNTKFKAPSDDEVWELFIKNKEEIVQLYYFDAWPNKKKSWEPFNLQTYEYWLPIRKDLFSLGKFSEIPEKDLALIKTINFWSQLKLYFTIRLDSSLITTLINLWGYYSKLDKKMFIPPLSIGANTEFPNLINFFEKCDSQYAFITFLGDGGPMYILVHEEHENKIVEKFEGGIIK